MNERRHSTGNIKTAFFLNLGFTLIEIAGGILTNSISIISDALHDLGDSLSLGLAWYFQKKSTKKANSEFTFGYERFSLLGALINSLVLIIGGIFIIAEAVKRIINPEPVSAVGMIWLAILGIAVNSYAAWKLKSGKSLNEKVISWHLLEDVMGWAAVLAVGITLLFTDLYILDPILSIAITIFILFHIAIRLKETIQVFLQATPADLDLEQLLGSIREIPKVNSLHHTHIWSLDGENHVFSTHLVLDEIRDFREIIEVRKKLQEILKEYPIAHHTIQIELNIETCNLTD